VNEGVELVEQSEADGDEGGRVIPPSFYYIEQQPQRGSEQDDAQHDPRAEGAGPSH